MSSDYTHIYEWDNSDEYKCLNCLKTFYIVDIKYEYCPRCGIKFIKEFAKKNPRYYVPYRPILKYFIIHVDGYIVETYERDFTSVSASVFRMIKCYPDKYKGLRIQRLDGYYRDYIVKGRQ